MKTTTHSDTTFKPRRSGDTEDSVRRQTNDCRGNIEFPLCKMAVTEKLL